MISPRIIQAWVDSVNHFAPTLKRSRSCELESDEPHEHEPITKRQRCNSEIVVDTSAHPNTCNSLRYSYDMPGTPPKTDDSTSAPRKRGSNHLDGEDLDMISDSFSMPLTPRPGTRRAGPKSPKKKRIKLNSRESLRQLEKSVLIFSDFGIPANLPTHIKNLEGRISDAADKKKGIMPHEVRDMVAASNSVEDWFFRPKDQEQSAHARDTYVALRSIVEAAYACNDYKRPEACWNHLVHTPLLQLIFGPVPPRRSNTQQQSASNIQSSQKPPAVHFEVVMGATVVGTAIPNIRKPGSGIPDLAYSVSLNTSIQDSDISTVDKNLHDPKDFHSEKKSKKVDYVLVMCINDDDKLKEVIEDVSHEEYLAHGHVNQTLITSLLYNPIAVSIKTKIDSSGVDPMIQLGLWVAAWHKRMGQLRERRFPPPPKSYTTETETETKRFIPKLVPVPLIQVKSHEWHISFAFDLGELIEIRGRTLLGSTESIVKAYALITNLELVKRWIETEFYRGITDWFTKDDDVFKAQDIESRTAEGVVNQESVSVG